MYKNKIKALLLVLVMVCSLVLTACGQQEEPAVDAQQPEAAPGYTVSVVDAFGKPYTDGVIVRFMQNGQQVTMQVVDENGKVTKDLEKGDYTVDIQLTNTDANCYYDQSDLALSADKTQLEIVLYNAISGEPAVINAYSLLSDGNKTCDAYNVTVGGTYVDLIPGERNYFLFAPTEAGTYEFSVQGAEAALGYYGATHFVQQASATEIVDNKFTMSIKDSMIGTTGTGTTVMVLGLDAGADETNAVLAIERIGDPQWDVSDEPWHIYQATIDLQPYTLPSGAAFGEFDLTAATDTYNLVLGSDNYYHLDSQDGPLVLVRLGKASGGSKYLAPFETILEHSGVGKYFYDEEGNFLRKESYDQCLLEYFDYMDEGSGLYPLTEDLAYIIQMRGDHYGWFDEDGYGYIFLDANNNPIRNLNHEISWLFMCCYIKN